LAIGLLAALSRQSKLVVSLTVKEAKEGIVMSGWRPLIKGYFAVAR
jgi:hypothetical protein